MSELPKTLGKYEVLDVLGRGGMGQVYLARDPQLDRTVAIKTLLAGEQATERFLERFRREAQMTAGLQHPNIVRVYDFGTEGKLHYIVMEHVDGRPLQDLLAQGRLEPERALRVAYSVARTLQFAHERRIVHRDIKPANLVVDPQGRVHILDFGLAKSLADDKALTLSFTTLGTAYYMSPEQAFGAPEEVDARADVYSLGAVLHEMLTGRPPFEGGTVLAILRKIEDEDPPPAGVSPAVDDLVRKALAKDRDRRFQTAAEMADAIRACLGGPALDPRPATPTTLRAPAPAAAAAAPPAWAWQAAAVAGALLSIVAIFILSGRPAAPEPAEPPPAVVTPEAELRALLGRRTELTAAELAPYKDDPALSRMIARHFQSRGQFTRALDHLRGYDRMMGELMSARALQRFVSPALFRLYIPPARELRGAEAFLAAALGRHFEGRQEAARLKLRAAENAGAAPAHVLLVRAHLDLCQVFPDPRGAAQRAVLAALREDLAASDDLYHLPLRAVAAAIDGDFESAREVAERFAKAAPLAAESFLLQAILLQREGRIALAIDQLLDAGEMDPKNFDASIHLAYLRFLEVLDDPDGENLVMPADPRKMDRAQMEEALEAVLEREHYPAALFLRAVLRSLDGAFDAAAEDLRFMARRAPIGDVVVDHPLLAAFASAVESRTRLLVASRDLQLHLGRHTAAMLTARLITGMDLAEEDRVPVLRENHVWMARRQLDDPPRALEALELALRLGTPPQEVRDDRTLAALRPRKDFQDLLRRYRETHRRLAKRLLRDEEAALGHLEAALQFGLPPRQLREDDELGDLRSRPSFADLLRRYEN